MSEKRAFIPPRDLVVAALLLGMALSSCSPTPTPTPPAPPVDTPSPTTTPTSTSVPTPPRTFVGKVCMIKSGWDTNTIFLGQVEFNALGLPIGTRVTVTVRDTQKSATGVMLSLDSSLDVCSVRLSESLRQALGVNDDVAVEPVRDRPDRQFEIVPTSPPTNEGTFDFQGRVCMIREEQDTNTIFLRQTEFNAFGVPAGTSVSVTVLNTGRTVEKVTLGVDDSLATCSVRLSRSLREALGVAGDTDVEPLENRPGRRFSIHLPLPG